MAGAGRRETSARAPRVVIAPDSFKASLGAPDVARALAAGVHLGAPNAEIVASPMADGGEGSLDCIAAACAGQRRSATLTGVHGRPVTVDWYQGVDGTGYIESAAVLGLPLVENTAGAPPIAHRSSAPLGVLMHHALAAGCTSLVVALGGSACNDAGLGLLSEFGLVARDRDGEAVGDGPAALGRLATLDRAALGRSLAGVHLRALCDVDNPLAGRCGATHVYGPQKGLHADDLAPVDAAFAHFARALGAGGTSRQPGAGAAGGLGFALAVLGAALEPGADALLRLTGLAATLARADWVITGEGRTDAQTLSGKTALAVARAARAAPTVLVSGAIDPAVRGRLAADFHACYSLAETSGSLEAARCQPAYWLGEIGALVGRRWASSAIRDRGARAHG